MSTLGQNILTLGFLVTFFSAARLVYLCALPYYKINKRGEIIAIFVMLFGIFMVVASLLSVLTFPPPPL